MQSRSLAREVALLVLGQISQEKIHNIKSYSLQNMLDLGLETLVSHWHEELEECGWVRDYMLNDIVDYMNENNIEINETTYRLELLNFIAENYNNEVEYEKLIIHAVNYVL